MTRRSLFAWVLSFVALVAMAVAFSFARLRAEDPVDRLAWIKERVRQRFPDVPRLTTEELSRRLESGEKIVLIDVRRQDEYAVSHLPGAIHVDPGETPPTLPPGVDPDATIVAYCSVGWRSSKWAEALRDHGVDAMNLEGSIFQWVAEDRPLVRDGEPVGVVHPYGRAWAWLVDPEDRAFSP